MEEEAGSNEATQQQHTPHYSYSQNGNVFNNSMPPLGLRLQITKGLVKSIENRLNGREAKEGPKKFPAAEFSADFLAIGEFNIKATNMSDLVARCYYGKRILYWEILDRDTMVKHKIEVLWDNILAMRAITNRNMPGILEIELEKEPRLFREEIDSILSPRKYTAWELSEDFTGGHAFRYRRHYLQFPTGVLDKYYDMMIQRDNRLLQLSQRPFPSLYSPFFHSYLLNQAVIRHSQGYYEYPANHLQHLAYSTSSTPGNAFHAVNAFNDPPVEVPYLPPMASEGGVFNGYANLALMNQGLGINHHANMASTNQGPSSSHHANSMSSAAARKEISHNNNNNNSNWFSETVNMLAADFDQHMGPTLMETNYGDGSMNGESSRGSS